MANFLDSFKRTIEFEGGYSDDSIDTGGFTYKGISRKNFPNWGGWTTIDSYKTKLDFPKSLDLDTNLQNDVQQFYKTNFWTKLKLDQVPAQQLADYLFDTAVNLGLFRAVTFLQKSLNILTPDMLIEDGSFGNKTLTSLLTYLNKNKVIYLIKLLTILRGNHYINIVISNSSQKKFIKSWLNRL